MVPESLAEAKKYVKRQLLDNLANSGDRLADALLNESPRKRVIEFVIEEVTGDSLQSVEQVLKAAALLGVQVDAGRLKPAFETRNQIIHEMDATLGPGGRRRRQRTKSAIWGFTKALLNTAAEVLRKTDARLGE